MNDQDATKKLMAAVAVTRENIARAKTYVLASGAGKTDELADRWLQEQNLGIPHSIDGDVPNLADVLTGVARAISVRLALYQAVWELIAAAELIPSDSTGGWQPAMNYTFQGYGTGLRPNLAGSYPSRIERPPLVSEPATDPDVFLQGVNCKRLHSGILEAIEQALGCFRRGLYMPATAMLAAAVAATWTECGLAVAKKLRNSKLDGVVSDPLSSVSKIVLETRKILEQPDGKVLLKSTTSTSPRLPTPRCGRRHCATDGMPSTGAKPRASSLTTAKRARC